MKKRYRNTAFLLELMINILVFSISCAVLVGLFGKAWQISRITQTEAAAASEVMSLVETVKARGPGSISHAQATAGDATRLVCYYDNDWQPLEAAGGPPDGAAYRVYLNVTVHETGAGVLSEVEALAETTGGLELYRITTAGYTPLEGGAAP